MQYFNETERNSLSWGTVVPLVRRYGWLILAVFLVTLITGWGVLQVFFTELYETRALVLVKVGRETTEAPTTIVNGNLLSQGVRIQDINSEVQMLSSPQLVEAAVDTIGPDRFKSVLRVPDSIWGYPKYLLKKTARFAKDMYKEVIYALNLKKRLPLREQVLVGVADSLKVEPVKESDVLVMKLSLPSPELAVDTANEILAGYLKLRSEVRRNEAARDYYVDQTQAYRNQLQKLVAERAKIRGARGLTQAEEQRSLVLKRFVDLEGERGKLESQLRRLDEEQRSMKANLAQMPVTLTKEETFTLNPSLQSLKERITNLRMERAKLLGRYQPESESVKQIEAEIAALENSLKREQETLRSASTSENNPLRKEFEKGIEERQVAIAGLRTQIRQVQQQIGEAHATLAALDSASDEFERVERDYRIAEQSFVTLSKRMSEARMSEDLDSHELANVSIIARPGLPIEPVYPRKLFIMGILLPVGLILGVGIAALLESLNDRIRTPDDLVLLPEIEYLGTVEARAPVLAEETRS